jgi:hypothetical protein
VIHGQDAAAAKQLDYTIKGKTTPRTEANDAGYLLLAALGAEHERLFLNYSADFEHHRYWSR